MINNSAVKLESKILRKAEVEIKLKCFVFSEFESVANTTSMSFRTGRGETRMGLVILLTQAIMNNNTSLAAKGALAHSLQNPKWPPGGPK